MRNNRLNRRNFLRNTSLGFLGAGLLGNKGFTSPIQDQENEIPRIKESCSKSKIINLMKVSTRLK